MEVSDEQLVRAAKAGDRAAFGWLSERHRPGLRATAIAMLGYTAEADDVVQDALLTALGRLSQLRDAGAVGAWLKAIVRNNCRAEVRARRAIPVAEPEPLMPPDPGLLPEQWLERSATADWVDSALASLSAPIREVTLLRYFSGISSYRQIANLCAIPPETVGSRLRDGRRALARSLRESTEERFGDIAAESAGWRRASGQLREAMSAGTFAEVVDDWYHPDARIEVMGYRNGDRKLLLNMVDWTLDYGVTVRLRDATASRDVLIWEAEFVNPPSDPEHCPPAMACLFRLDQGRVARMGILYGAERD